MSVQLHDVGVHIGHSLKVTVAHTKIINGDLDARVPQHRKMPVFDNAAALLRTFFADFNHEPLQVHWFLLQWFNNLGYEGLAPQGFGGIVEMNVNRLSRPYARVEPCPFLQ